MKRQYRPNQARNSSGVIDGCLQTFSEHLKEVIDELEPNAAVRAELFEVS